MNVFLGGMCVAMIALIGISYVVSKRIKDANDFYVAGRKAPVVLIAGSMIASYTSTGMFMGDAAECYEGILAPMLLFAGMQSAGYIVGAVFFGRYLRRSASLTIPEFFGKRFSSSKVRIMSAVTAVIMMTVYLLSVVQGVGTLMTVVTGADYKICIIIAMLVFTFVSVVSGSRGVLITDTIMAGIFTLSMLISVVFVASSVGGWFSSISRLASNSATRDLLAWTGKMGVMYDTGIDNMAWGISYGVVWMSVCAVGPWQSSRYLMAKDEHTIIKSAPIAALGVFILEFFVCMTAVIVNVINPHLLDASHVWIWLAVNVLPPFLGVILMTGVLSAGISSATTFLSLIGSAVANDIVPVDTKKTIKYGRIAMVLVSVIVLICALINPAAIFFILFLGGATAASSWMPVAFGSIFSKRMTKTGAFWGMFAGMAGCLVANLLKYYNIVKLPSYLDPAIIGIVCNVVAIIVGSMLTQVTDEEKEARAKLFIMPDSEKNPADIKKTLRWSKFTVLVGIIIACMLIVLWVIPYIMGVSL